MAQASISITQAYATLGLEKGADMDAVKKAYKEKALQTHPDKVPEERRVEATIEFQNVGAAYETITKHHQGPDSDDDDEFDFGPGHMPHFHFGHGFGGRGGSFFYSPFSGMFFDDEDEEIYINLFDYMFGFPGSRPSYGRSVPRNRRRGAPESFFDHQERLRRRQEAEAERERAKLQRAEEDRRAREQREREREAKAKAAAARKAREEAKKKLRNDPVAAAAAEEARRVEAEKRDREAARQIREALERPQRVRSTVFEAARKGNAAAVKKGVWEDNVDAAGPEVLPRASDLVKVRPADWNKLETLLHIAVSNGDKDLVEWLITHNAEPDERDSLGQTPFNRAVHLGDMSIIHYFLDEFPPDSEDSEPVLAAPQGDTTLRLAVASTNPAVVTTILHAGLINPSDAAATWAWIDEQEGQVTKKLGGKYDKVRGVLRKIEGWTPPASPEAHTNPVTDPESPLRGGFTQQRKKKNRNGGNQHQGQASAPASAEPPAATSNKPVEVPFTTRFNNSRGRGGRRGRGRARPASPQMAGLLERFRRKKEQDTTPKPQSENEIYANRLARRQAVTGVVARVLPYIRFILYFVGYVWMILIPFHDLSRGTWVDENALQPAQVTTYWSWDDVHAADNYLAEIEGLYAQNATNIEKAAYIEEQFISLGLDSGVQPYKLSSSIGATLGANAYGVYPVPRASGAEAIVISASWVSRTDEGAGTPNMRGVATVLALARYLTRYSLWAKDLIFVVNDGHVDGMHAWLNAYHGIEQSNLQTKPLKHVSGVIWTALCIDYPGHSFSHLGVFYEGLNGRLPNQDLMNSVVRIAGNIGVPTILYDNIESSASYAVPQWLADLPVVGKWTKHSLFQNYLFQASNVKRHVQYEGLNRGSGVHGLFHKFRIDAITLFGVPAMGPHGFHSLGQVVESSLRTMNNLLERLHASFFFYILTSITTFVNFGGYLASAILVSVSMIFGGLRLWVVAGWKRGMMVRVIPDDNENEKEPKKEWPTAVPMTVWRRRDRPVIQVLAIMLVTHVIGYAVFLLLTAPFFFRKTPALSGLYTRLASLPLLALHPFIRQFLTACPPPSYHPKKTAPQAHLHLILKAFNLYISSIVISITSVLNFSLAAALAVLLGVPLALTGPTFRPLRFLLVLAVSPMGLLAIASQVVGEQEITRVLTRTVWEWQVLGAWFLPFVCVVYLPLTLQGLLVCVMPRE